MGKIIAPKDLSALKPTVNDLRIVTLILDRSESTMNIGQYTLMGQNLVLDTLQKYDPNAGIYVVQVVFNHDWNVIDTLRHVSQGTMMGMNHLTPIGGTMLFKTVIDVVTQVEEVANKWRKLNPQNTVETDYGIFTDADEDNNSPLQGVDASDVGALVDPLVASEFSTFFYCGMGGGNIEQHGEWATDMRIPSTKCFIIDNHTDPIESGRQIRHAFGLFSQSTMYGEFAPAIPMEFRVRASTGPRPKKAKTPPPPSKVDIIFVLDTTGSMDDKISALKSTLSDFVSEPVKHNLDATFTLVSFGDVAVCPSDRITTEIQVNPDIKQVRRAIERVNHNYGGDNDGESSLEAIKQAMAIPYREGAVKVMIHLTDEPALQHEYSVAQVTRDLRNENFLVFTVTPDIGYFKTMAQENGGTWTLISAQSRLDDIEHMFEALASQVAVITSDVHRIGSGDVQAYMRARRHGDKP